MRVTEKECKSSKKAEIIFVTSPKTAEHGYDSRTAEILVGDSGQIHKFGMHVLNFTDH